MTEASGGRGRNRRIRKKGRPGKRARTPRPRARRKPLRRRSRAILVKAVAHPVRRLMLREINAGAVPLSPAHLAKALDLPLAVATYHAAVLQKCGAVEVAKAEDG